MWDVCLRVVPQACCAFGRTVRLPISFFVRVSEVRSLNLKSLWMEGPLVEVMSDGRGKTVGTIQGHLDDVS